MGFFFQAEDGIRDLVRSRGLGDVYKRQDKSTNKKSGEVIEEKKENRKASGAMESMQWMSEILSLIHI